MNREDEMREEELLKRCETLEGQLLIVYGSIVRHAHENQHPAFAELRQLMERLDHGTGWLPRPKGSDADQA